MKRLASLIVIGIILACVLAPMTSAQQSEILVSTAAGLSDVLRGLAQQAEQFIGAELVLNFEASGSLRRPMEGGAPVEVFFSGDVDKLLAKDLLADGAGKEKRSQQNHASFSFMSPSAHWTGAHGRRPTSSFLPCGMSFP